jgi:deazaflavin-dependent oxidoreductase (nitroreductase family)
MTRSDPRPDLRQRFFGGFLRILNPVVRRMVASGLPTGAPNILLTVRGRRSGAPRTVPVGIVAIYGRRFIQASYGEQGWVRNLRAAGSAIITEGEHQEPVTAVELSPDEGGEVLYHVLERFHRSRLLHALLGPRFRPPVGVLWQIHLRVDDSVEEYVDDARRHPVFELLPGSGA